VKIDRRLLSAAAVVATLAAAGTWPATVVAAAETSASSLAKEVLPPAKARSGGFTKVVEKVTTTSKTGVKSCPNGAQEAFADKSGRTDLVSEVVACSTTKAAGTLLTNTVSATSATTGKPPKRLGSSALERSIGSVYAIYWRRGTTVEVVAINTDVPASQNSSTSSTVAGPPLTSTQQRFLDSAANAQDALSS